MDVTITTFEELAREYRDFAAGNLTFLVVVGERGIAKTEHARKYLPRIEDGGVAGWVNGRLTGYGLWLILRSYRNLPIVLDDADDLFRDKAAITTLKQICGGDGVRHVSWATGSTMTAKAPRVDDEEEEPEEGETEPSHTFATTSPVMILTNAWEARTNPHVKAVGDRGTVVRFVPSTQEIHRYVGEEIVAKEVRRSKGELLIEPTVYAFVGEHLATQPNLSIRHYIAASERLRLGREWEKELVTLWELDSPKAVARRLFFDESFESEGHRERAFEAQTGRSRQRYRQIKGEENLRRPRGGAREGAGRKPKAAEEPGEAAKPDQLTS